MMSVPVQSAMTLSRMDLIPPSLPSLVRHHWNRHSSHHHPGFHDVYLPPPPPVVILVSVFHVVRRPGINGVGML